MFVQILISSILEILLFSIIPFFWWLARWRKKEGFFSWIGFRRIERKKEAAVYSVVILAAFFVVGCFAMYIIRDTSLPEEIFFRGFLLKGLNRVCFFPTANLIQSIVFGMLHGMMFAPFVGIVKAVVLILCTGGIAYAMGYVNEQKANGSIFPSWMIHFISNLFSGMLSLFSVI